jgi:hypothetical protein
MLKAGNRLVLGLLAAALAAGLATSVFVRPQSRLTASDDCYGACPSVTEMFMNTDIAIYGHEEFVHFDAMVRPGLHDHGRPTGTVLIESGGKVLCTIHLDFGEGMCSPGSHALSPGFHLIVAHYEGGNGFKPSTSVERTLFVLRHPWFGFGEF